MTEPAAACPDEDVLLAFLEGRLGDAQRASAAAHVDGCESCQEVVAAVAPALLSRTSAWGDSPFVRDSALARGATIGRYVILGLVGRGGMGEVYAAYDPELDRKIALKILHASAEGEAEAGRARMLREAKAIARLSHPNVVVVHDAGTVGGRVFIAMEFVDGRTLADWLKESPRDWREVREVFLAAGRALAAAHVAGLVHRDFKPQNVMVGDDGKVRVMDFGLASTTVDGAGDGRHLDLPGGAPLAMERVAGVALTRTGVLLGTPAYMAPEQFRAEPVDPRTDQFSYCVSLHEALHGERPFVGQSVAELALAVTRGDQREPEQRNRAPVWLRRIIQRGLQPERERRWPSMDELLAALERDPGRARRRWLVAAAAVLLLAAGIVGQRVASRAPVALCRGAAARLTGVWEGAGSGATSRRETTRKVFATASPELGADTWRRVSSLLDGYAQKWTALYTTTCEATQLRGEQSVEVMDLKMDCLGQALDGLASLTGVFAEADRGVVIQAIDATLALPELNRCKDVQALRAVVPPPRAKEDRTRVDELRRRNAEAKALLDTGRVDGARRRLPDLLRAAEGSGYAPVVSEVALNAALLSYQIMALDEAEALNERAFWSALESRQDELAANAAAFLAGMLGNEGLGEKERRWERMGMALLVRMGPGHDLTRSWLLQGRGNLAQRERRLEDARAAFVEAVALKTRVLGPDHPDVALSVDALGQVLEEIGDREGALAQSQRALAIMERAYGKDSPLLAYMMSNRGEVLNSLGRPGEALPVFRRSLELSRPAIDAVWNAYPLTGIGQAFLLLGRPGEAVPPLERALLLREKGDRICQSIGETRFALARALAAGGDSKEAARARLIGVAARDDYATCAGHAGEHAAVVRWLDGLLARR